MRDDNVIKSNCIDGTIAEPRVLPYSIITYPLNVCPLTLWSHPIALHRANVSRKQHYSACQCNGYIETTSKLYMNSLLAFSLGGTISLEENNY